MALQFTILGKNSTAIVDILSFDLVRRKKGKKKDVFQLELEYVTFTIRSRRVGKRRDFRSYIHWLHLCSGRTNRKLKKAGT